jgi:hypothetical protein
VAVFRRLAENRNLPLRILYPLKFQFLFYVWGQKYSDMKKATILCLFTLLLALTASLKAQIPDPFPTLPLAPNRSPVFGKDVVIHDQPDWNQKFVSVASAFNGWLFAAIGYQFPAKACILKSEDKGITWEVLFDGPLFTQYVTSADIIVCGNDLNTLRLFPAFTYLSDNGFMGGIVYRLKAEPFEPEAIIFNEGEVTGLSLAHDGGIRNDSTDPYSIGILYAIGSGYDTVYFHLSTDAGTSFYHKVVAAGSIFTGKVSLSYGYSPSKNSGRYYAVWEERQNYYSDEHNLFTSHSEPNIQGSFTTPRCLDSLDQGLLFNCRNPVISTQSGYYDNDSLDITSIILFEKKDPVTGSYDIGGFYNRQSTTSDHFQSFSVTNPSHENLQPDIVFNPEESAFMATYYDTTLKKLPFLSHNVNMINPDDWQVVSNGYNDAASLSSPNPRIKYNGFEQSGMNVWISQHNNGNGKALFDSQNSTYTAIQDNNPGTDSLSYLLYPNPSTGLVSIHFVLKAPSSVVITVYSSLGQPIRTIVNKTMTPGPHDLVTDLSSMQPGFYFVDFKCNASSSRKILTLQR